jgi:hypothetical protein
MIHDITLQTHEEKKLKQPPVLVYVLTDREMYSLAPNVDFTQLQPHFTQGSTLTHGDSDTGAQGDRG